MFKKNYFFFLVLVALSIKTHASFIASWGGIFVSKQVRRGVLVWDAPTLIGGPSFRFFNFISLRGQDGLSLQYKKGIHQFRLGMMIFDDSAPQGPVIKFGSEVEDFKNLRKATFESYFSYTFNQRGRASFKFDYFQDHKGNGRYGAFTPNVSIFPLWSLGSTLGFGNSKQNRYLYGNEAKSGIGHYDLFTSYRIPWILPYRGMLIIRYTHSTIARGVNRHSFFTRGKYNNDVIFLGAFWRNR